MTFGLYQTQGVNFFYKMPFHRFVTDYFMDNNVFVWQKLNLIRALMTVAPTKFSFLIIKTNSNAPFILNKILPKFYDATIHASIGFYFKTLRIEVFDFTDYF